MSLKKSYPLASFDVHLDNFRHLSDTFRKNNDISRLINVLDENFWTLDLTNQVFHEDYDALVLTDQSQKIKWVSNGFSEMTGYTKKFALGKRPALLQGVKTSIKVKKQIRKELKTNNTFEGSLINYKKNGEEYNCQIKILPLYNSNKKLEYFLAIEKEIPMVRQQ